MTKPRFKGYETDSTLQRTVTLQGAHITEQKELETIL